MLTCHVRRPQRSCAHTLDAAEAGQKAWSDQFAHPGWDPALHPEDTVGGDFLSPD